MSMSPRGGWTRRVKKEETARGGLGRGSRHVEEARLDDDVAVENLGGHHLVGGFDDLLPIEFTKLIYKTLEP